MRRLLCIIPLVVLLLGGCMTPVDPNPIIQQLAADGKANDPTVEVLWVSGVMVRVSGVDANVKASGERVVKPDDPSPGSDTE